MKKNISLLTPLLLTVALFFSSIASSKTESQADAVCNSLSGFANIAMKFRQSELSLDILIYNINKQENSIAIEYMELIAREAYDYDIVDGEKNKKEMRKHFSEYVKSSCYKSFSY